MKGVLFHDNKSLVSMAAVHGCGFELFDHPPYSSNLDPYDYRLFPNMKKKQNTWLLTSITMIMTSHLFFLALFLSITDQNFHQSDPYTAANIKEVCGLQGESC